MKDIASNAQEILSQLSFCVIDLETTGGNHETDQIIEIGMVKIQNLEITAEKDYLVNPERNIPDFIQRLTRIKPSDVKDSPKISEVIDDILDFIGDSILVAHNTSFDIPFLNSVLRREGKALLTNNVLCTNVMTKHMIPEILSSNLGYMCELFKIDHGQAHRALEDAKATAILLLNYLEIFNKKGLEKVNQLYYPRNRFELDRIHLNFEDNYNEKIDDIFNNIAHPIAITIKKENGIIIAALPIAKKDITFLKEVLDSVEWTSMTLKLIGSYFEGMMLMNTHFFKFEEIIQQKIINYYQERFPVQNEKTNLFQYDFILTPHLVNHQLIVYNLLNLIPTQRAIFKLPAHRRKLAQFITSQNNRFESQQKGKKKIQIITPLVTLFENYLQYEKLSSKPEVFFLNRKINTHAIDELSKELQAFLGNINQNYNFPLRHL
jgi:DNA polymerase-3 subunit alpha (Gram-positive type)